MANDTFKDERTRLFIWSDGDGSVGIPGQSAEVLVGVANDPDDLLLVKELLVEAFRAIWDERRVHIRTEAELKEEETN